MAPHTQTDVITEDWNRPYSREQAAFPAVNILLLNFRDYVKICGSYFALAKKGTCFLFKKESLKYDIISLYG